MIVAKECIDRRIVRTERAIKDAFMELMCQKEISKITVKEVADRAEINRKTFYLHYNSVRGILEDIENDIMFWIKSPEFEVKFKEKIQPK